jgi:hypothetical protein
MTIARSQVSAEAAHAAFMDVAQMRTKTTAQLLSRARTHAHCLWQNENLTDEEFNADMIAFCIELTGDELAGRLLASAAIWGAP